MTKHLRFLIVLLMTLVWSAGWAAIGDTFKLVTDANDLKAGDKIIIGSKDSKVVLGADNGKQKRKTVSATFSNDGVVAWQDGFEVITLEGSASAWYLHLEDGYLYSDLDKKGKSTTNLKASPTKSDNNIASITVATNGTSTISFIKVDAGRAIYCNKSLTPKVFGYYQSSFDNKTLSQIYKLVNSGDKDKTSTTLTFPQQSLTYATTDDLTTFTGQTATLTADGTELTGKTITYSKSGDDIFSSFDTTNGTLVLNGKAGTAKITATFDGGDTYASASAEYTLNVIDPNKTDVTFDFTKPEDYGYGEVTSGNKELNVGDKIQSQSVVITNVKKGSATTRFSIKNASFVTFRVYKGAILTVEAPAGFAINKIDFTDNGSSTVDNFTFSTGELKLKTWTGLAEKLTMEVANAQVFLKDMTVNLVKVVTLNESADNTIEAKTGVNVTLKRSMVENEWNTICLPFNVTAEQAKTAFGEGVMIAQLNKNSSGNKLSFSSVDAIVASTPYLIKPTIAAPADGYKFEGVTINDDGKGNVAPNVVNTNSYLAFVGIYNTVDVTNNVIEVLNNNYYAAFLGANNTIFKAKNDGGKMKGFRAYFAIPNNVAASALCVMVNGTATSIKNIDSEVVESNAPVYNLQGQRVDGNNLTPGIYVKAGKKFVVK